MKTWESVNNGLTTLGINAMAINDSNQIFVATSGGGVFRTEDFGENWSQVSNGLGDLYPRALHISADNTILTGSNFGNISISHNNGQSWETINENLPGSPIRTIATNSPGEIYAGTVGDGIYRFSETDSSWEAINSGLPNNLIVLDILVTPTDEIYIGTTHGIFKSTDNGNSWNAPDITGLKTGYITTLGMDEEGRLYAGTLSQGLFRQNTSTEIKQPEQPDVLPNDMVLYPNYPNPFNPVTTIQYLLSRDTKAHLIIYDVTGRIVSTLVDKRQTAGTYSVQWNGTNDRGNPTSAGLYFYKLTAGDYTMVQKMIFLK